jgi:hypothetical protein
MNTLSLHVCIYVCAGEEEKLKDRYGNLAFDLRSDALDDKVQFPNADSISRRFEVVQEEGEVIFVPSRWHHQVFNLVRHSQRHSLLD